MSIKLLILIAMTSLIVVCQSTPAPIDAGCMAFRPIETNAEDRKAIPRPVKLQIAQHNEMWDKRCGNLKQPD
jgi:hypothetical protein